MGRIEWKPCLGLVLYCFAFILLNRSRCACWSGRARRYLLRIVVRAALGSSYFVFVGSAGNHKQTSTYALHGGPLVGQVLQF